jgi:calcineurin-like phosphoesterase family protein
LNSVEGLVETESLDEVHLKGFSHSMAVFNIIDVKDKDLTSIHNPESTGEGKA